MIEYTMLRNVDLSQSVLPSIDITPEGRALGSIPGWTVMVDPDYIEAGAALNRAQGEMCASRLTPQSTAAFGNGATAFDMISSRPMVPGQSIDPNSWSLFSVINLASSGAYQRIMTSVNLDTSSRSAPYMGFSAGGSFFNVWDYQGGTERLRYTPPGGFLGRTMLLMITFSVRDGLRIFDNGALVASNLNYKDPLEVNYLAGQWELMGSVRGLVGMSGLLNIDLGWLEHGGYRRLIERFMSEKYGIG